MTDSGPHIMQCFSEEEYCVHAFIVLPEKSSRTLKEAHAKEILMDSVDNTPSHVEPLGDGLF